MDQIKDSQSSSTVSVGNAPAVGTKPDLSQELANLRQRVQFSQPGTFLHVHDCSVRLLAHLLETQLKIGEQCPVDGRLQIGTGVAPSHLFFRYTDRTSLLSALEEPGETAVTEAAAEQACLAYLYSAFKSRCGSGKEIPALKAACAAVIHRLQLQDRAWITAAQAHELLAECLPMATRVRLEFDRLDRVRRVDELETSIDTNGLLHFETGGLQGRTLQDIGDELRRALGAHVGHNEVAAGAVRYFSDEFRRGHQCCETRFLLIPPRAAEDGAAGCEGWLAIQAMKTGPAAKGTS